MVLRPLHLLTIGVLVVAGTFAFPAKTSAGGAPYPPTTNVPQIWQNRETGYCLGVAGGRMVSGTPIIVWPCNGNPDQAWITVPNPDPNYGYLRRLKNVADPTKCLSVAAASWRDGARMIIWDCLPVDNHHNNGQGLNFVPGELPGYGFYSIDTWSDMCVGVAGASSAIGASVIQWHCLAGHGDQEWYPSVAG
jgi:hypothetical protein